MPVENSATSRPMISDFCMPRSVSAYTSPPVCVVPNQWSSDGPWRNALKSWSVYSHWLRYGPTKASRKGKRDQRGRTDEGEEEEEHEHGEAEHRQAPAAEALEDDPPPRRDAGLVEGRLVVAGLRGDLSEGVARDGHQDTRIRGSRKA